VSLGHGEWVLDESKSMRNAYWLLLTIRIFAPFQLVTMDVGSRGAGVYDRHSGPRKRWGGCLKHHGERREQDCLHLECRDERRRQ
jgi:hypothetical protein